MKAVVLHRHGGPESLVLETRFPDPELTPGKVLVRIRAVSLNYHDVFTCRGMPGAKYQFPHIIGMDYAGEIAALGEGVQGVRVGERVLVDPLDRSIAPHGAMVEGGCAEYCVVRPQQLLPLPASVSFEEAACLPVAYGTAYRMMLERAKVQPGEKVLILGASGGVGNCCVMLGRMIGAEVIACGSSEEKLQALKELGADHLINYAEKDFVKECWRLFGKPHRLGKETGVDVVVNYTGGDTWVKSMQVLKSGGRMTTCGATAGFDPQTDIRYIWSFELNIVGSNAWEGDDLRQLLKLVENGRIRPLISKVLPLERTAEGVKMLEDRAVTGKIVITL
jgi:alcohol dehydrogenase